MNPNAEDFISPTGFGLIPRDFSVPLRGGVSSETMPTIPRSEWRDRIKDKIGNKSRLTDIRNIANNGKPIPSLDQGQKGYCWAHSSTMSLMMLRAVLNLPYIPLSAYAVACTIKNYRDEGGWAALSLEFLMDKGAPDQKYWPQGSMSSSHDNATTWANAAYHTVVNSWLDMNVQAYDQKLSFDQVATLLLNNEPTAGDFNWWGHSVCILDLLDLGVTSDLTDVNAWGVDIINSWGDSQGNNGIFTLKGQKAIPDGAVAPRTTKATET